MKAVVCRVDAASVEVERQIVGRIGHGLLVYLGVMSGDGEAEAAWMAAKLAKLRLFSDDAGKINRCVTDLAGGVLLIPNFTLAGETSRGTRPSFSTAAAPQIARGLFQAVRHHLAAHLGRDVPTGSFGAHMVIHAQFDGPVTVIVDSEG